MSRVIQNDVFWGICDVLCDFGSCGGKTPSEENVDLIDVIKLKWERSVIGKYALIRQLKSERFIYVSTFIKLIRVLISIPLHL